MSDAPDKFLTKDDIIARLDHIKAISRDDEMAHSEEDALHQDVLFAIAEGDLTLEDCREYSALALKTAEIEFARWCA